MPVRLETFVLSVALAVAGGMPITSAYAQSGSDEIEASYRHLIETLRTLDKKHDVPGFSVYTLLVPPGAVAGYNIALPVARIRYEAVALFGFDETDPLPSAKPIIEDLAKRFKAEDTVTRIAVVGHTDSVGSDDYNYGLSLKRALSIASSLSELGVPKTKIAVIGLGESDPVANNATERGRSQNRRVEFYLSPVSAAVLPGISGRGFQRNYLNSHNPECAAGSGAKEKKPAECGRTEMTEFPAHKLTNKGIQASGEIVKIAPEPKLRVEEKPEREHVPNMIGFRDHVR